MKTLHEVAVAMVADGKGLLAADESVSTIKKRFDDISVENTAENRRDYRDMLFSDKETMSDYISGVILFDEQIRSSTKGGVKLTQLIENAGSIPGIKVDAGAKPLPFCPGETVTEGLDGLAGRLKEYRQMGARFAKWRAVIDIADGIPSTTAIHVNAHALARYAALCLEADIVPIVEPEVLMDGDHDLATCEAVTTATLYEVFNQLFLQRVTLEEIILKPNMIVSGKGNPVQAGVDEVAEATVRVLKRCVPASVPGIAFLSGGQSEEDATAHLSAMNANYDLPWKLTFSYGRALQAAALAAWGGKPENVGAGQKAFAHRARMNWLAGKGEYNAGLEQAA